MQKTIKNQMNKCKKPLKNAIKFTIFDLEKLKSGVLKNFGIFICVCGIIRCVFHGEKIVRWVIIRWVRRGGATSLPFIHYFRRKIYPLSNFLDC